MNYQEDRKAHKNVRGVNHSHIILKNLRCTTHSLRLARLLHASISFYSYIFNLFMSTMLLEATLLFRNTVMLKQLLFLLVSWVVSIVFSCFWASRKLLLMAWSWICLCCVSSTIATVVICTISVLLGYCLCFVVLSHCSNWLLMTLSRWHLDINMLHMNSSTICRSWKTRVTETIRHFSSTTRYSLSIFLRTMWLLMWLR